MNTEKIAERLVNAASLPTSVEIIHFDDTQFVKELLSTREAATLETTDKQDRTMEKLERKGFRFKYHSPRFGFVVMTKRGRSGWTQAEIDEDGNVNGERVDDYLRGIRGSVRKVAVYARPLDDIRGREAMNRDLGKIIEKIAREILSGKTNFQKFVDEYETDDYPYGRFRTTAKWWVEGSRGRQRVVRTTINPKTGRVNAPKKTTYGVSAVIGLGGGRAYPIVAARPGQITIWSGDMKYSVETLFEDDPDYRKVADALGI